MKRSAPVTAVIIVSLLVLCAGSCSADPKPQPPEMIPRIFRPYVYRIEQKTGYLKLAKPTEFGSPAQITREQALEDIKHLKYVLKNGYSGYTYWKGRGVDFDGLFKRLREFVSSKEKVRVDQIEDIIYSYLSKITDGHLSFHGTKRLRFHRHKDAYFSYVITEKKNGRYVVIHSQAPGIKKGMPYTGNRKVMFPTLSPKGKRYYLVGTLSYEPASMLTLSFENQPKTMPLHACKMARKPVVSFGGVFFKYEKYGVPVLRVKSFGDAHHEVLMKFVEWGDILKDADAFIVNACFNQGGDSRYPRDFIIKLNSEAQWIKHFGRLLSPAVLQGITFRSTISPYFAKAVAWAKNRLKTMEKRPKRVWQLHTAPSKRTRGDYRGKAVVLSNRHVCSSGEAMLDYWKSIPGGIIVGENSGGVGAFGEVMVYMLPHSRIKAHVPCKLFLNPRSPEGVGFMPDYWLDVDDPVDETAMWLKDPVGFEPYLMRKSK